MNDTAVSISQARTTCARDLQSGEAGQAREAPSAALQSNQIESKEINSVQPAIAAWLFYHAIRSRQHVRRNREVELLCDTIGRYLSIQTAEGRKQVLRHGSIVTKLFGIVANKVPAG